MLALTSETALYLLRFTDTPNLEQTIQSLLKKQNATTQQGETAITKILQSELNSYFEHTLTHFSIPLQLTGTTFQQQAWQTLCSIDYGKTKSYSQQAQQLDKPMAHRAVARANGTNLIAIIIPCHRVIHKKGTLSGYNGGIKRKQWLLHHESKVQSPCL